MPTHIHGRRSHLDGVACTETELLGSRTNWNRRIHSSEVSGANFHCRAACNARLPKYRLDPIDSLIACITEPLASTLTRIRMLIFPRMVFLACVGTSGKTF